MEDLIKKTKKKTSKELIDKVENGKLSGDDLTAALEVLKLRNVVVTIPGSKKPSKREITSKNEIIDNLTKHPLKVGTLVSFIPAKNSPLRKLNTTIEGKVINAFSNSTQHWVRIKLDDGTKVFKLTSACTKVK